MLSIYRSLMNENENPLQALPPAQRFQLMLGLSVMWTTVFCLMAGAWVWYGELMIVHILFALGFAVTGITFAFSRKSSTYRDNPAADGTARYDDVWGA